MSWQDYEHGPSDDGTDHLIDQGWLPPGEAEDLQIEIEDLKLSLAHARKSVDWLFMAVLGLLVLLFAWVP